MENSAIITLRNVSVRRGENLALDAVNFDLFPKTILGLIGPNGAGKTTLLQIILGELKPDTGEIFILGKPKREINRNVRMMAILAQGDRRMNLSVPGCARCSNLARPPCRSPDQFRGA